MIKPVDVSRLRKSKEGDQHATQHSIRRERLQLFITAAIVVCVAWLVFRVNPGPSPTPTPGPNVEGLHVMVIFPDSMAGLSPEQVEFVNSANVADRVEELGGKYRRYAASQNLDKEEPVWREIRGQLSPPYGLALLNNRRLTKAEIPQGIEAGIRVIEGAR